MRRIVVSSVVALLCAQVALRAHHSPVLFDMTKQLTIEGKVVEFTWTNPHSSIQVDVPNSNGGTDRWGVEMGSPTSLVKAGWKSTTVKYGDHIKAVVRPLKSGEHGGLFVSVTLDDGRTLGGRAVQ